MVTPDKFQESEASDAELRRAQQLANGEAKPITGFEIHFIQALYSRCRPHTPKEQALLEQTQTLEDDDLTDIEFDYGNNLDIPYKSYENEYLGSFWNPPRECGPVTEIEPMDYHPPLSEKSTRDNIDTGNTRLTTRHGKPRETPPDRERTSRTDMETDDTKIPEMRVFGGLPPDAEAAWEEMDKLFNPDDPLIKAGREKPEPKG